MHTAFSTVAAVTTAAAIAFSASAPSFASTTAPADGSHIIVSSTQVNESELSAANEEQLAADLEVLFTRYIQLRDNTFVVQEANLKADGFEDHIPDMHVLANAFNQIGQAPSRSPRYSTYSTNGAYATTGVGDFALCVALEGLGIPAAGASPGLIAAIKEGIRAWNWGLTARTVARILGPSVAKALGGPVGIGVALGWAAWSCRGKL